jgi:hypothetical protein
MLKRAVTLALVIGALVTACGAPSHAQPAGTAPMRSRTTHAAARGTMAIDGWYTLAPPPAAPIAASVKKQLDTTPVPDGSEWITVFATRHNRDADWRGDQLAAVPVYEAENSAAAQRLYAPSPSWDSPEEQRLMSNAKDAMGLCGALGGWVSCPNK